MQLGRLLRYTEVLHQEGRRLLTTQVWLTVPGIDDGGRIGRIHGYIFPRSAGPTSRLLPKMRSSSRSCGALPRILLRMNDDPPLFIDSLLS